VTFTFASTAPLESPPGQDASAGPLAKRKSGTDQAQHQHALAAELKTSSQRDIRNDFGMGMEVTGMEQILQISGPNLLDPIQLACATNLAIIAQG